MRFWNKITIPRKYFGEFLYLFINFSIRFKNTGLSFQILVFTNDTVGKNTGCPQIVSTNLIDNITFITKDYDQFTLYD